MKGSASSGDTGGDGYKAGYTEVLDWRCRRVVGVLASSFDKSKYDKQTVKVKIYLVTTDAKWELDIWLPLVEGDNQF